MKTVDIFASVATQMAQDTQVHRYGAILVRSGVKGFAKLNPTIVWVDATIALIEAGASYFRYCAEREITRQIREFNRALERTLEQELQIGELALETLRNDRQSRLKAIERTLSTQRRRTQITQKRIRQQLDLLKNFHYLLQQERQQLGNFQELINLQVCLDGCIDVTLGLLLSPTGENE